MLNGLNEAGAGANWQYITRVDSTSEYYIEPFPFSHEESWYGYRWAGYILNNGNHSVVLKAQRACKCNPSVQWRGLDDNEKQK